MNFTQSFEEFSSGLAPMDLALYAGAGIILWVLFKDRMSPVQEMLTNLINQIKGKLGQETNPGNTVKVPPASKKEKDLFFDLVVSWKQTRDLAVRSGCSKAVEVADQMFPYLSPMVCGDVEEIKESNDAE
jgi:hypothetical protein